MKHTFAGRMSGASGVVTYCMCGLAFFEQTSHPRWDTERGAQADREAQDKADARYHQHAAEDNR